MVEVLHNNRKMFSLTTSHILKVYSRCYSNSYVTCTVNDNAMEIVLVWWCNRSKYSISLFLDLWNIFRYGKYNRKV